MSECMIFVLYGPIVPEINYSILFYSILFYSILFYSILFYSLHLCVIFDVTREEQL